MSDKTKHALAQLRHLYAQMVGGPMPYPAEAARGLLGPAIEKLEEAEAVRASDALRALGRLP